MGIAHRVGPLLLAYDALIRHPLHLAEAIATVGVLAQYRSAEAAALVALQFAIQLWRMGYNGGKT